jgi:hypothetical protein
LDTRNKKIFAAALAVSILTAAVGMLHQGYPPSGRFYIAMPGTLIGLLLGYFLDSQILVVPAIILSNAITYYGIVRGILQLRSRKGADSPSAGH